MLLGRDAGAILSPLPLLLVKNERRLLVMLLKLLQLLLLKHLVLGEDPQRSVEVLGCEVTGQTIENQAVTIGHLDHDAHRIINIIVGVASVVHLTILAGIGVRSALAPLCFFAWIIRRLLPPLGILRPSRRR